MPKHPYNLWLKSLAILIKLGDTARYAGLLAPAKGFGLQPRFFFALRAKKRAFYAVLANFW